MHNNYCSIDERELEELTARIVKYQLGLYDPVSKSIYQDKKNAAAHPCSWLHGCFYLGLVECAKVYQNETLWKKIIDISARNEWKLGPRLKHADDHVVGQTYLEIFEHTGNKRALENVRVRLSDILRAPSQEGLEFHQGIDAIKEYDGYTFEDCEPCKDRWSWCDALYMAPALWAHLSSIDGDPKYLEYADQEFWESHSYLFDSENSLFFRDSRFFDAKDEAGDKLFWSRGNGWVLLGLRRIIDKLPGMHPSRQRYIELFQAMAKKVAVLQSPSGFWNAALSQNVSSDHPESTGTAMFVAGFAWGVRNQYLPKNKFIDALEKGWQALMSAVHSNGKVGWVQDVAEKPDNVRFDDTHIYGSGAMLHACAELKRLVDTLQSANE